MLHVTAAPRHALLPDRRPDASSLGRKVEGTDDDWVWSDAGGSSVSLHFERGRLRALARSTEPE